MKKLLLLLFLGFTLVGFSQTTLIPDPNFEQALIDLGYDTAPIDGQVLTANISSVTSLDVSLNFDITDLTGIEDFTALATLRCYNNQLTSLDVSNNNALTNLDCSNNQLTSLDVTNNNALIGLVCAINQLTSLDVTNNTALTYLNCYSNQLTSLDVTNNTALTDLDCRDNQLTSLDVSNNPALSELYCDDNQLTSLDLSNNPALAYFDCSNNQLTSLDVTNNNALIGLVCANNQLTSLDVTNNNALTELYCNLNQLTSLDVTNNNALTVLICNQNQLTSLDVSNNNALTLLICNQNQLTSLDVSNNNALTGLICNDNQLISLDVRNGNNIIIDTFDTTNNPNLTCIYVDDASYSTTNWTDIDPASTFVNNEAECDAITPPVNDLCIDAIDLDDITLPHSGSTVLASSFDAPECEFVYPDTPGVWYVATVPNGENYMVTIDTFGSLYDTTLSILTGDCFDLVCLISNDDSSETIQSEVVFEAISGNTYYIYVSGFDTASGEYILNADVEQLAINDNTNEGFSFYPNPSTGTINLSAIYNIEKVTIYTLLGQKVLDQTINAISSQLNVVNLVTGAYLMQVSVDGKTATYKVLKN